MCLLEVLDFANLISWYQSIMQNYSKQSQENRQDENIDPELVK